MGYYKKATNKPSVTWEDTVDEALCYGWIDGIRKSRDDESYMVRFTPRKSRSVWSQRNIDLVERLTAEGRMKAEGLDASASDDNGVLIILIPIKEGAKPRKVEVAVSSTPEAIGATAS